jgi:tripartite-type tricarboxylate transporter receptor subunit TctC
MASTPFMLVVNPSVAASSVRELVALAQSRPGKLHYGSGGSGSPPHLAAEMFRSMTGMEIVHVPYTGVTPALTDTVGGQVQMTFSVIPACLPLVRSGKVRALGVTSRERTLLVADVPTLAESVPGYEFVGWYGLVTPAGTRREVVGRLNAEVMKALKTPEFQEKLSALGAEPIGSAPQELASFMRAEMDKMRKAVKASGARSD